jgi:hypothetical protein
MVLDERSRHELRLKLEQVLGPEQATTLMEMLPPVGWADVATKRDLDQLEQRMDLRFQIGFREIRAVEDRLHADFANQTRTIVLAMLGSSLAILATTLGAVFAMT